MGGVYLGVQDLDLVPIDLGPTEPQEFAGVDAVPAEVTVHRPGGRVAGLAGVNNEHSTPAPAEHERGAQPGRTAAHDQDVVQGGMPATAIPTIASPPSIPGCLRIFRHRSPTRFVNSGAPAAPRREFCRITARRLQTDPLAACASTSWSSSSTPRLGRAMPAKRLKLIGTSSQELFLGGPWPNPQAPILPRALRRTGSAP